MTAAGTDLLYPPTVVGPKEPLPMWRFLPAFVRNPLRSLPQSVFREPLVRFPRAAIVWVTDPSMIERILLGEHEAFPKSPLEKRVLGPALGDGILTSSGQTWRFQRRTAAPLFRHQELLRLVPEISASADVQIAQWRTLAPGATTEIERDMTDVTYDVVTRTLLGGAAAEEGALVKRTSAALLDVITWDIAMATLQAPEWLWHPGKRRMRQNSALLRETVRGIVVRNRRQAAPETGGLVGRLLAARDPDSGAPMSDDSVVDNLLTFLLAGHETTAKALTWTLYLVARAPKWQELVCAEVMDVAGHGPIEARHLERLAITTRVLKEGMRLYPPAPVLVRMAARDTDLGGHALRAGTQIVMPIFAVHRHRKLWDDPDHFDPDRFLPEREAGYVRTQFMPFGFGPRSCIGMSFAMIEATVLLAAFVRAARFGWDGRHLPEPVSRVTLRPKGGMPLRVEVRRSNNGDNGDGQWGRFHFPS